MFRSHLGYLFSSLITPQKHGAEYSFKVNAPAICCNPQPAPFAVHYLDTSQDSTESAVGYKCLTGLLRCNAANIITLLLVS